VSVLSTIRISGPEKIRACLINLTILVVLTKLIDIIISQCLKLILLLNITFSINN